MNCLFISTYNEKVIIGLLNNGKELLKKEKTSIKGHSELIVPTIAEILKDSKLDVTDLNEIIVVNGPGSFTGVRLGITVAKTLAYTLNIPIKTITSIEAISTNNLIKDKLVTINDSKGKYIGKFINNKLEELIYLKESDAIEYINSTNLLIIEDNSFNLEAVYNYAKELPYTNAHAVKALYVKKIEALNGK